MKKITALGLSLLLVFSLAACGGKAAGGKDTGGKNAGGKDAGQQDMGAGADAAPAFEPIVLVDNEQLSITVIGFTDDGAGGFDLRIRSVNKTSDTNYTCYVEQASVNGVTVPGTFLWGPDAGQTLEGNVFFTSDDFLGNDIGDYTAINLPLVVFAEGTEEHLVDQTFRICPYGEDKATCYTREAQPTDAVIVDNEYVTVTVTNYVKDDPDNFCMDLFYENKTDMNVEFGPMYLYVNDTATCPMHYGGGLTVGPAECGFARVRWEKTDLADFGVTDVTAIIAKIIAHGVEADSRPIPDATFAEEDVTLYP